jgi:stringent starvation protein A
MAVVAKRSVMTLFTSANDIYSHQVRIVLAEKGVNYETVLVDQNNKPEDLLELNPYNTVPTLVDRDLVLFEARIIMEYLDERFPHPPLMPVYPVARASSRLMMHRIERDWYSLLDGIYRGNEQDAARSRNILHDSIMTLAPVFAENPYFLSEEFSLVDCFLAPLFWRLPEMGIEISGKGAKEVHAYMERVFSRDCFKESLTPVELSIRNPLGE